MLRVKNIPKAMLLLAAAAAGAGAAGTAAGAGTGAAGKMMNNTNFPGHNLPAGGCDPVVSSNFSTALDCQRACDQTEGCDIWTFVSTDRKQPPGMPKEPWCCLKGCGGDVSNCPAPEAEQDCTSGYSQNCTGPSCFSFAPDWSSGSALTTLPTMNFSVRKFEAVYYPPDGHIYAYVDIVNFSDIFYPDSYSSEVGVYSSPDGFHNWTYHGIVIPRGAPGDWDGGGIASPGAAVASDGTVLVGYAAEKSPSGGINRGIGVATASHPLGPFAKSSTAIASPTGICGGHGRCDDVIMQSRSGGEVHLYHSVKGSDVVLGGDSIHHRMTKDSGRSWSNSTMVLQHKGGLMETIGGKFFPTGAGAGEGSMVLVTDGVLPNALSPFMSTEMDKSFVPTIPNVITPDEMPPQTGGVKKGNLANLQIGFVPSANGTVVGVAYALWTGEPVYSQHHKQMTQGYTHTIFRILL